ncbi:MAG TPA: hypothetical protein VJI66_02955 [Candidatus Paceibacterota bacterium]
MGDITFIVAAIIFGYLFFGPHMKSEKKEEKKGGKSGGEGKGKK